MLFNLFNLILILPILFIYYYFLVMTTKGRNQIYLGVTLPYGGEERAEVKDIFASFKKVLLLLTIISAALFILLIFLIKDMIINMTVVYSLALLYLLIPSFIYIHYHKKLKAFVDEHHLHPEKEQGSVVDVKVLRETRAPIKWPIYLLMLIPQLLTLFILRKDPLFFLGLILSLTSLLGPFIDYTFSKMRSPLLYEHREANVLYQKIYQKWWKVFSYGYTFLTMLLTLSILKYELFIIICILLTLLLILLTVLVYRGMRKETEEKLSGEPRRELKSSDDHWLFGIFYNNPQDRKLLVEKRVGMGSTLNIARPAGKVIMIITLLAILGSFVLMGNLLVKGLTPFSLNLTGNNLEVVHQKVEEEISLEEIEEVRLLDNLPELRRIMGTATDTFLEGKFSSGDREYEVYLNPENPPFLEIETSRKTYLLGNKEGSGVEDIFRRLP